MLKIRCKNKISFLDREALDYETKINFKSEDQNLQITSYDLLYQVISAFEYFSKLCCKILFLGEIICIRNYTVQF